MKIPQDKMVEAIKSYKAGEVTMQEIADKFGVKRQRIHQIFVKLRKLGVELPKNKQNNGLDYEFMAKKINEN